MIPPPVYCAWCAARLVHRPIEGRERPYCEACERVVYLDPKVAACAIPVLDGRIVLARRDIDPGRGLWTFPGGYADRGETVEEAAAREVREEVGVDVRIGPLIGVYSFHDSIVVVVVYRGEVVGGTPHAGHETQEVRLVTADEIPWDHLAFDSTRMGLREFLVRGLL